MSVCKELTSYPSVHENISESLLHSLFLHKTIRLSPFDLQSTAHCPPFYKLMASIAFSMNYSIHSHVSNIDNMMLQFWWDCKMYSMTFCVPLRILSLINHSQKECRVLIEIRRLLVEPNFTEGYVCLTPVFRTSQPLCLVLQAIFYLHTTCCITNTNNINPSTHCLTLSTYRLHLSKFDL